LNTLDILVSTISELETAEPLSPEDCSRILNVELAVARDVANPYFTIRRGKPETGDVSEVVESVELRTPNDRGAGGLLILDLRDDLEIIADQIETHYAGLQPGPASPTAPISVPDTLSAARPWGTLAFGVARDGSKRIVVVTLDEGAKAPREPEGK